MSTLVTGGAGYIGAHVVRSLLHKGTPVVVLDNLSKGHREHVPGGVFVEGDIRDAGLLCRLFKQHKVTSVVHMAGDSLVGESVAEPAKYFENNVGNGLVLLDSMLRSGVSRIIFSSTAAVYGEPDGTPITEEHPCRPTNPYGWSKLAFEHALEAYRKAGSIRYVSLRYFNAAGADPSGRLGEEHDPETHLIPNLLNAVLGKIPHLDLYGTDYATPDGTAVRDYIHVTDLAEAHVLADDALRRGRRSGVYNLGNGQGFSVREIISKAEEVLGCKVPVQERPRRAGDPEILVASSERIKDELGWKPNYSDLDTIIRSAWKWAQATVTV